MSKSQREKGAAFEREVCKALRDELGLVINRNLAQTRDGGYDIKIGQFRLECKRRQKISLYQWWHQIESCCQPDEIPVLAIREDAGKRLYVIDEATFASFVRGELK